MSEKWEAFPLLYLEDVLILLRQFHMVIVYAPVAQGIEHRPPEAGAAVRIRPGVYFFYYFLAQCVHRKLLMAGPVDGGKSYGNKWS